MQEKKCRASAKYGNFNYQIFFNNLAKKLIFYQIFFCFHRICFVQGSELGLKNMKNEDEEAKYTEIRNLSGKYSLVIL